MYILAEIYCESTLFFDETSFLEMHLERNGVPLEDTIGQDRFLFNGAVLPGRRAGATGRACRHGMNELTSGIGFGTLDVPAGHAASVALDLSDELKLRIRTNLVLDPGVLAKAFSVRLRLGDSWFDIPLSRPDVEVEWVARGEYLIPLESFLVEAFKRHHTRAPSGAGSGPS